MKLSKILFAKSNLLRLLIICYIALFVVVSRIYYDRLGVFGCGDECINYTAGYFILNGKILYKEIFFNHQPALAFVSSFIQGVAAPTDLYHLVLYHRLFVGLYAFVMGVMVIWRFRTVGALFVLLYEGTKYYMYGYQFIGEAFVVYPLVFLFGFVWNGFSGKILSTIDLFFAAGATSLVVLMREPYIPVAVASFMILMVREWKRGRARWPMIFALVTSSLPFMWIPLFDYLYEVGVVNLQLVNDISLLRSFFYPLIVFVSGTWSLLRFIEIGIATFFWIGVIRFWRQKSQIVPLIYLWVTLVFAALRSVLPGTMYYEAFHMLPWYGLFIMATILLLTSTRGITYIVAFFIFTVWAILSPKSFVWERVDRMGEFESQYAKYTHYSEAIRLLSEPAEPIFLDMWDDIIYWESRRPSSYPLQLYMPIQAGIAQYQDMRLSMFHANPPVLYYSCPNLQTEFNTLPATVAHIYTQLKSRGKPGCLYVRNDRFHLISEELWFQLEALDFTR